MSLSHIYERSFFCFGFGVKSEEAGVSFACECNFLQV
jgi:hypothetical protein